MPRKPEAVTESQHGLGWEGSFPLPWAGTLPPDQGVQSPIQPGLEHCQGGSSQSFAHWKLPMTVTFNDKYAAH